MYKFRSYRVTFFLSPLEAEPKDDKVNSGRYGTLSLDRGGDMEKVMRCKVCYKT